MRFAVFLANIVLCVIMANGAAAYNDGARHGGGSEPAKRSNAAAPAPQDCPPKQARQGLCLWHGSVQGKIAR